MRRRDVLIGVALAAVGVRASAATPPPSATWQSVLDYLQAQKTTGFLAIRDRRLLAERNWPAPAGDSRFAAMLYGASADGALLEDVASQQKSFVSVLTAIAVDKGLLDVSRTVTGYDGPGWSKATAEQEGRIRVIDVLTMSSGLTPEFAYAAPPGTVFLYNTPVYAVTKRLLAAAGKTPIEALTRDWLTAPVGMGDTAWRQRPAALADVGNPTGLVTTPRDVGKFGQLILDRGRSGGGRRVVSEAGLAAMFARSPTNPAYGRLWWLNGSDYTIRPPARRTAGPLIPAAPPDLVAALGALDRKLYIVPSRKLIVVRMGPAAPDRDFDQQLWLRLMPALG